MDILLVGKRHVQESVGVEQKLNSQIAAFKKLGHNVFYTCARPNGWFLHGPSGILKLGENQNIYPAALSAHINNAKMLLAAANGPTQFQLCYIRKPLCDKLHLKAIAAFRARGTVVIDEIPTYPYDEELKKQKNLAALVFLAVDRHYRKKLPKYLNAISTYSAHKHIFGLPAISVENAMQVDEIPLSFPPKNDAPLALIAVSSMYFWHGYDRLIAGLGEYKNANGKENIVLHLVGDGPEKANWQALAQKLGLENCVFFHGICQGAKLAEIFDKSHIGVSSLGWHRKGMGESPTFELKTRDYISRGKPFLFSCQDPRAMDVLPYSLKLPNNNSPINMGQVLNFYKDIKNKDFAGFLRQYAQQHLRWEAQMQKIVSAAQNFLPHP